MTDMNLINLTTNTTAPTVAGVPQANSGTESKTPNVVSKFQAALEGATPKGQNIISNSETASENGAQVTPETLQGMVQGLIVENTPVADGAIVPSIATGEAQLPSTPSELSILPNGNGQVVMPAAGSPAPVPTANTNTQGQNKDGLNLGQALNIGEMASTQKSQNGEGLILTPNSATPSNGQAALTPTLPNTSGEPVVPQANTQSGEGLLTPNTPEATVASTLNKAQKAAQVLSGKTQNNKGIATAQNAVAGNVQSNNGVGPEGLLPEQAQSLAKVSVGNGNAAPVAMEQAIEATQSGLGQIAVASTPNEALQAAVKEAVSKGQHPALAPQEVTEPSQVSPNSASAITPLTPVQQQNKFTEMLNGAQNSPVTLSGQTGKPQITIPVQNEIKNVEGRIDTLQQDLASQQEAVKSLTSAVKVMAQAAPLSGAEVKDGGQPAPVQENISVTQGVSDPARLTSESLVFRKPVNYSPAQVAQQIGLQISKHVQGGETNFQIRIDPPELGRLNVRVEFMADGGVKAVVLADNKDTLNLLQREAAGLEKALAEAGLKADSGNLNFSLNKDAQENSDNFGKLDEEEGSEGFDLDGDEEIEVTAEIIDQMVANNAVDIRI